MADEFASHISGLTGPATKHNTLTPNSGTDLNPRPRALYVSVEGDVAIRDEAGVDVTYPAVPAHTLLPFRAVRLLAATTATVVGWR